MPLTITSNTVLDEEYRATQTGTADDNDVASSPFISGAVTSLGLATLSGFSGFPQYAENTSFVTTADPVTDWHLSLSSDGVGSSIHVGGNQVFLYATSDPDIIVGRVGNGTTANASGAVALIVGIDDSNVASPQLWTAQYAPFAETGQNRVDSADQLNLSGLVSLGATYTTSTEVPFENFASVKSGQDAFAPVASTLAGAPDVELLVTGFAGRTAGTVNVSTTGLGTNAQHIDPNESIRIDIVSGLDTSGAMNSTFVHDASNIEYASHVDVYYGEFSITQLNPTNTPATVSVFAYEDDTAGGTGHDYQGTAFPTNAISDPGTSVKIDPKTVIIKNAAGADITTAFLAAGNSIVSEPDGKGVKITGLLAGYQVGFATDNVSFDRFVVTNTFTGKNPSTFDVGAIEVKTLTFGSSDESTDLGSHLIFQDDGPKIALSGTSAATITDTDSNFSVNNSASFAALFTAPDYGADGAGSLSYTLGVKSANVDSGLIDTASGQHILLSYDSSTNAVYGKTQTSGVEVFKITVDSWGHVTLDQSKAISHGDTSSSSEISPAMAADLITLSATATDSEAANHNDSATATANIGGAFRFQDDGPTLTPQPDGSPTPNDLQVTNGGSDSSSYGLLPGGDGLKSYTIVGPPDSSGDFQWTYDDASHTSITGTYDGTPLYTLSLQSDGTYDFTMLHALQGRTDGLTSTIIHAGGPTDSVDVLAKAPSTDYAHIVAGSTIGDNTVNASHGYVGVDNGNLDAGESLTFSLYSSGGTPIDFSQLKIDTKSAGASHYDYFITTSDGLTTQVGFDELVPKGGTITVSDPNPNDNILIQSVEVYKADGNALKIGLSDIQFTIPPDDVQLGFSVQLTDGDNDTATQSFTVSIDGNGDGIYGATVNSAAVMQTSLMSSTSTSKYSGMHIASADLSLSNPLLDLVHYHHADYMLV